MHLTHVQNTTHDQPQEGAMEVDNLEQLSSRIIHDHMRLYDNEEMKEGDGPRVINLLKPKSESLGKRR